MTLATLVWGSPEWLIPVALLFAVAVVLVLRSYVRSGTSPWGRSAAAVLKLLGLLALSVCVVEPLYSGIRPRPGSNVFVILADNSQSLLVRDGRSGPTRGERVQSSLMPSSSWLTRLAQDFDLRRYLFDSRLRSVPDFGELSFSGQGSALAGALRSVAERWRGRPNAGVLLLTDGNATDAELTEAELSSLPPVYPVIVGSEQSERDLHVARVSVNHTNFEVAPVTIAAEAGGRGVAGQTIVMQLVDESGEEVQQQRGVIADESRPFVHRFQLRPDKTGVGFYRVRVFLEAEEDAFENAARSSEATLVNNTRWVTVDRGQGPYRVLYVSGRPNWDFKFLRRSVAEDGEVHLVGLIRVAKREPKFTFRGHQNESTNPLYRGFGNQKDEQAEQYDQPVLVRLDTEDSEELRDGFPKAADQLFRYHAIILDDVESAYFTQEQMSLLQHFVSQRGGGLLMLGGRESFAGGAYERTPIGEMLPVYSQRLEQDLGDGVRLLLTREGQLQPWVRLRPTEPEEDQRIREMPPFRVLSGTRGIKPGATVLAQVEASDGKKYPALVVQRFGRGRSAALLIGDLWRWQLRRSPESPADDLEKCWRQTVRWLVADVPGRLEVDIRHQKDDPAAAMELAVTVRDPEYKPLDDATVHLRLKTPEGKEIELTGVPSDQQPGVFLATFIPRVPGPYRLHVTAAAADGNPISERQTGWCADPAFEEFERLSVNRPLLQRIAEKTGGEVLAADDLDAFVRGLPNRKVPVTEPWIYPLWHQWSVLLLAIACFAGEWSLRRWKGLP